DEASFVVNALAPAEVSKIVMDEETGKMEVVVPDEQLSLAIGRRGQNVRLASMLTNWDIDIMTEEQESEKRQAEFNDRSEAFIRALDVDEVIARLLVTEGFTSVDEVAYVPVDELASIEGFNEELAEELRNRARNFLEAESARLTQRCKELGVEESLINVEGLTLAMVVALGEADVKTIDDFADLAADELTDKEDGILRQFGMSSDDASDLIMQSRVAAGWFTQEELDEMRAEASEDDAEEAHEDGNNGAE
ncbi:MAG: helix-hairpin-helix domain-containing protein, partial [Alphaproteobacteria bacterium]|nr:helix-hairpin-helix domain-containing protein [Alphaproteobacteria bacterium]